MYFNGTSYTCIRADKWAVYGKKVSHQQQHDTAYLGMTRCHVNYTPRKIRYPGCVILWKFVYPFVKLGTPAINGSHVYQVNDNVDLPWMRRKSRTRALLWKIEIYNYHIFSRGYPYFLLDPNVHIIIRIYMYMYMYLDLLLATHINFY